MVTFKRPDARGNELWAVYLPPTCQLSAQNPLKSNRIPSYGAPDVFEARYVTYLAVTADEKEKISILSPTRYIHPPRKAPDPRRELWASR